MREKAEAIKFCLTMPDVFEDYPFHEDNMAVIRHRNNKKVFAWVFERNDFIWINVKCDPQWRDFWRETYASVLPGWHLNKEHWNSIILDGSVPDDEIKRMIKESYKLTSSRVKANLKGNAKLDKKTKKED